MHPLLWQSLLSLNWPVNRRNSTIWGAEKPPEIQERPLPSFRVSVWCGISASFAYEPFFLNDNATATVTSEKYQYGKRVSYSRTWEINCSSHVASTGKSHRAYNKRKNWGFDCFSNSLISRLTPCNFFLWGCLKLKILCNKSN